jgi:phospholipid/cholesterol/gamma-HCH transport system ATP-binding protein
MISVRAAGKRFDDSWVFRGVNVEVRPGESVVILGPSGCGKSTLLRLIAGLVSPDEGTVSVESENVGMLFQRNALFDSLTVEENLFLPLKERLSVTGHAARERTDAALSAVGLEGTQKLFPDNLSGGMQKRLGIARALIIEPEVVLYDDPTAGLDPITSRMISALINSLRKSRNSTVVTVTNDPHRALQMGERIFQLALGTLLDGGTPEEVRSTNNAALNQFIRGLGTGPLTSVR